MADVKYVVTADTKGATKEIKKVDKSIGGMKQQAQKSTPALKGMFGQLAAGLAGTIAIGAAMRKLSQFMGDAIERAKAQELAEKGLTDALQSTGREIPINAEHFKRYAQELQSATLYGDEQVLSAQALLIQLTDLDREGLDVATKGSLGLATVFKTDLKAATNLVAKALAGNYGALSRYGISVQDLNTDEEKRASLLDQLSVLYERAKGEVGTYEGTVKQLSNTYGDFKEKVGDIIVKSEVLREDLSLIQQTMENFIASGVADSWAAKFDLILQSVPIFDALRRSLILLNIEMEGQLLIQQKATEQGEAWLEFLKDSDAELKIFGVDIYEAMRRLVNFGREADNSAGDLQDMKTEIMLVETSLHPFLKTMVDVKTAAKEAQPELKAMFEESVPAARQLLGVVGQAPSEFKAAGDAGVQSAKNVRDEWEIASERLQDTWARELGEMITEFKSFKDFFSDILGEMWRIFADFIGKMIVKWTVDFLEKTLIGKTSDAVKAATSIITGKGGGGGTAGKAAGAAGGGGGDLLTTLAIWGAVFQATFWSNILKPSGPSKQMGFDLVHEVRLVKELLITIAETRMGILIDQQWARHTQMIELLTKQNAIIKVLRRIRKNLEDMPSGQGGLDFYSGSRGGLVRYHPREQVTIQPRMNFSPQFQTVVIEKNDKYIVQVVQDSLDRMNIRVPTKTLVTR